jgi:hypothetical protein
MMRLDGEGGLLDTYCFSCIGGGELAFWFALGIGKGERGKEGNGRERGMNVFRCNRVAVQ